MAKRVSVNAGDVFTVPIDTERVGFVQVIAPLGKTAWYFVAFDEVSQRAKSYDIDGIISRPVAFLALTFNDKVRCGDWVAAGNVRPNPAVFRMLPAYKIGGPGRYRLEDYSGTKFVRASASEVEGIPLRQLVSPQILEDAMQAKAGVDIGPELLRDGFDLLLPSEWTTVRVFGESAIPA